MATAVTTVESSTSSLQMQDFLKLLLTQLTMQDPLSQQSPQDFLVQIAQFTNLQQTQQISENTTQMLSTDLSTQSINLLGKTVSVVTDASATPATGKVTGIRFDKGQPSLTVLTPSGTLDNISLSQIASIL